MSVFQVKGEYFVRASSGNTERPVWKSNGTSNENFYYNGGNIDKKLTKPTHVSVFRPVFFSRHFCRKCLHLLQTIT